MRVKKKKSSKNISAAPQDELDALPELDYEASEKKSGKKKKKAKRRHPILHKIKIFLIILFVLALLIAGAAAYGGYYVSNLGTTLPKLYIDGVSVGGMTEEQVEEAIRASGWEERVAEELTVTLPADVSFKVRYLDAGFRTPVDEAVKAAVEYGHTRNWFKNLYEYAENYLTPAKLETETSVNKDYIRSCIKTASEALTAATQDKGYEIDKDKSLLRLVKGAGQIHIDEDGLLDAIVEALENEKKELSYSTLKGDFISPDFQALHDKLAAEPKEAYFTEKFEVVDEIDGCWFEVDEAQKLWNNAKALEVIEIPIKLTYPAVTGDSLRAMLYRDKLGEQTTYFPNSIENRISNIRTVAEKLNGTILMPGETFSYNDFVGERTREAGFLPAGAYENGQVVEEVGGGICQVSSTLYCATMYAQMDTVARSSHYFRVDYLPLGQDATVSWPKPDFKFKNSREYPVKIIADCSSEDRYITIEIWGTDLDGSYVELRHDTYTRFDDKYPDVAVGYYVLGYRDVYEADGTLRQTISEPPGDYWFHEEDIKWPEEKFAGDGESIPDEG